MVAFKECCELLFAFEAHSFAIPFPELKRVKLDVVNSIFHSRNLYLLITRFAVLMPTAYLYTIFQTLFITFV